MGEQAAHSSPSIGPARASSHKLLSLQSHLAKVPAAALLNEEVSKQYQREPAEMGHRSWAEWEMAWDMPSLSAGVMIGLGCS